MNNNIYSVSILFLNGSQPDEIEFIVECGMDLGTRFRPLSFNTPKPLIPLAGQPMIHHPISACKMVFPFFFLVDLLVCVYVS